MAEKRLVDIELKLLALEDLAQELGSVVYGQQKQIDELRALCASLAKRLGAEADEARGADAYTPERPPHY